MELKAATVAAQWWAYEIMDRSPNNFDIGAKEIHEFLASMFLAIEAEKNAPSVDKIETFEKKLNERINIELKRSGTLMLHVDYTPEGVLSEVLTDVGISPKVLPVKTTMHISKDEVSVSKGYGAPFKVIFSN